MFYHNVGAAADRSFAVKKIDVDFFEEE